MDARVLASYYCPALQETWYITEAEHCCDGNWVLYGYHDKQKPEWGYTSIRELRALEQHTQMALECNLYPNRFVTVRNCLERMGVRPMPAVASCG